jgi:hypothetical protein
VRTKEKTVTRASLSKEAKKWWANCKTNSYIEDTRTFDFTAAAEAFSE